MWPKPSPVSLWEESSCEIRDIQRAVGQSQNLTGSIGRTGPFPQCRLMFARPVVHPIECTKDTEGGRSKKGTPRVFAG